MMVKDGLRLGQPLFSRRQHGGGLGGRGEAGEGSIALWFPRGQDQITGGVAGLDVGSSNSVLFVPGFRLASMRAWRFHRGRGAGETPVSRESSLTRSPATRRSQIVRRNALP